MINSINYIVEGSILISLLFGIYYLIRNQLSFSQRRWVLLMIPCLSIIVFGIKASDVLAENSVYNLPVYELHSLSQQNIAAQETNTIYFDFGWIYWLGVLIVLSILIARLIDLRLKLISKKIEHREGLKIVRIENETCFSFFNFVQLNPELSLENQEVILQHEKIHVFKKHSYDILFIECMHALNWFNPFMILFKKELMNVHEYEVDQIMYGRHKTEYMEFLLSYSLGTNSTPHLLTNQFYSKNTLIKRLNFMKTKTKNRWAFALALPIVASSFALVSWTFTDATKQWPPRDMQVIVDEEIEKMPEFVGGQEALGTFLSNNIVYPQSAKDSKIEGKVIVGFTVTKTGDVTDCVIKHGVDKAIDSEALRVVQSMPDWVPGEKGGKTVNTEMTLPINFKL